MIRLLTMSKLGMRTRDVDSSKMPMLTIPFFPTSQARKNSDDLQSHV